MVSIDERETYFKNGFSKIELGDHAGAIKDFDKVIELDSTYTEAYFHRGIFKTHTGDHSGALTDFVHCNCN